MMQNTGQAEISAPDMLHAFTGISSDQVVDLVRTALSQRGTVEAALVERLVHYPLESLTGFLFSSSAAFYLAERGANPRVKTFVDALYYIGTCLSGYAGVLAQTQTGRAIATLVMAFGPALTANVLDPPGKAAAASVQGQEMMIERLDAILDELRKQA
ncbi:MAG: two pore domain potassium channel family protein [Thermoflexales bacterium]|nr:two pore domain potassium channel family protein [Thermoflexales bacterium]